MIQPYINFRFRYFLQLVSLILLTTKIANAQSDYIELNNSTHKGYALIGENLSVGSDAPIVISEAITNLDLKEGIWRFTLRYGDGNGFFYAVDPSNIEEAYWQTNDNELREVGGEWLGMYFLSGIPAVEIRLEASGITEELIFDVQSLGDVYHEDYDPNYDEAPPVAAFTYSIFIDISEVTTYEWYPDSDGDTFGDHDASPVFTTTNEPPSGSVAYVQNNLDTCPNDYSEENDGCPVQTTPPPVLSPADLIIDNFTEGYVIVAEDVSRGATETTLVILESATEIVLTQGIWRFTLMEGDGNGNFYNLDISTTETIEWDLRQLVRTEAENEWFEDYVYDEIKLESLWITTGFYSDSFNLNINFEDGSYKNYHFDVRVNAGEIYTWYADSDDDGFGDAEAEPEITFVDQPPYPDSDYSKNNLDTCPLVYSEVNNGCPIDYFHNWTSSQAYDINGNLKSSSRAYFDDLGKPTQTQSVDVSTGRTWASQTLYDSQGRPALQTLSAPVRESGSFVYAQGFFTDQNNQVYDRADFETNPDNPTPAGKGSNTVGRYYSTHNTTQANSTDDHRLKGNTYQDVTSYPFTRTVYSDLNPGTALKILGGNKQDGQWKQSYTFSMPAGDALSRAGAFNDASYTTKDGSMKLIKTINRDVHGTETVVFTDTDGRTLAAARTGSTSSRDTKVRLGAQGYVDVHVPVGITTGFSLENLAGRAVTVYNLITEQPVTGATTGLTNGFYRVAVNNPDTYNATNPILINCKENYYDYSLSKYDEAGRLIKSYQPLQKLESTYEYNALGELTQTRSPDEGDAWFLYRKDGQIRFSTNSKQWANKQFSYTRYDELGRPVESGVYTDAALSYLNTAVAPEAVTKDTNPFKTALENLVDSTNGLNSSHCSEQQFTIYDAQAIPSGQQAPEKTFTQALNALNLNATQRASYTPHFLASNVAVTYTKTPETTTTWYSYDVYGRVEWVIQNINGLGVKTIDYQYNPITGLVTQVDFQKYNTSERFSHRYTYDPTDDSLIKVETSANGGASYTTQANYKYYETGELKRTEIAPLNNTGAPLQGIDYVYNLNGQLKAINHPSLTAANDPGGDANDLFGMQIDYHSDDYKRSGNKIEVPNYGLNQYNGNIKGIRWNNKNLSNSQKAYSYHYNKNNWLTDANFGDYTSPPENPETPHVSSTAVTQNNQSLDLKAGESITLRPGFHAQHGSNVTARIIPNGGFDANSNGDYNVYDITYDANGNIQTLNRNKNTANGSNAMDRLGYVYDTTKPNQLKQVTDAIDTVPDADDIESQDPDNYDYNSIGQLERNNTDNITYLYYTNGLVKEVQREEQGEAFIVKFYYNDKGHRVRKESYVNDHINYTEHYVRDASGTTLAIYREGEVLEHTIYGASRLGVYYRANGNSVYQLTDHLGNVRAVVERSGSNAVAIVNTDYYPFGMPMPNRNVEGDYRYAYQGQEKDAETGKEAFQLRLWDSRIGRWLTTDPMHEFSSPYLGMGNNPISKIDPTGGSTDDWVKRADGSIYWDPNANSQATTKAGETWLGTSITFTFNSFIDGAIWDGPGGQTPAGDKLTSYITLQGQENANGELTGISAISTSVVGSTPVGTARDFYPGQGGSNNVFSYSNSSNSFNLNFEQHASVSPIEEFGLNAMGFQIVDVAQKLNISVQNGNLSYSAYTNVFPSATLSVDGIKLIHYKQPSFLQTHTARPIYKRAAEWLGTGFHYQTLDFSYYPSKFYKRN